MGSNFSSARQIRSAMIFPVSLVVNSLDGFIAGVGDLLRVFRELDFGDKSLAVFLLYSRQLVDGREGGAVFGGDQISAYAPGVDGGSLGL